MTMNMILSRGLVAVAALVAGQNTSAHIRITPVGRMGTSDAVKFVQPNRMNPTVADNPGPCANFVTRMATPLKLNPGQQFSFSVQETINHPGRFYVQFSPAADAGFWLPANQLALVEDNKNNGTTVVSFTVPSVNTTTATIRVLQEMDEQPGEYYVHCVDVNIGTVTSEPPPPAPTMPPSGSGGGGTEGTLSAQKEAVKPGFGGCGVAAAISSGRRGGGSPPPSGPSAVLICLFSLPLLVTLYLRSRIRRSPALPRPSQNRSGQNRSGQNRSNSP